jgi:hypothetical protein
MNKIQQFIVDNNIDLSDTGSELNGNCVILAGFALHLNEDTYDFPQVVRDIEEGDIYTLSSEAYEELARVFNYAYSNNYFKFWDTPEAKEQYVF